jgi:CheY-like chemotaxis protein
MPDLDGAEVLARMGAEPHLRDVPVVIVTSVDLGIDVRANLSRAQVLLAKADVTHERVVAVLAGLDAAATS